MPKLSVIVITKNEAADLGGALDSVRFADEIIVVDSGSTDETVTIARRYTDRVVVREWPGYVAQKNFAASLAHHDWVLSLDADERVTPALAREIQTLLAGPPAHKAYRVPRVAWYLGQWIHTTDWYPDHQTRLYDKRAARWTGARVHESVAVEGPIGALHGELQHLPYRDLSDHLETIDRYTSLAAQQMQEEGRHTSLLEIAGHPPLAFLRNYLLRGGFQDGAVGFLVSVMNAYYVFLKFAKLWERTRSAPPISRPSASGG